MLDLCDDVIVGIDKRGRNIYTEDFRRNFAILRTCKKLTPEGRRLKKVAKFYRSNERKIPEDYQKMKGVY